jgi:hypothetical protein
MTRLTERRADLGSRIDPADWVAPAVAGMDGQTDNTDLAEVVANLREAVETIQERQANADRLPTVSVSTHLERDSQ